MGVDDGLDLLGMNLEAADIDDAAAPADEMIAIAAQLHHVAGIDKAVGVSQRARAAPDIGMRGSPGADPQAAVDDLDLDAVAIDAHDAGRKALPAVIDRKPDTGFGRRIGMADRGRG